MITKKINIAVALAAVALTASFGSATALASNDHTTVKNVDRLTQNNEQTRNRQLTNELLSIESSQGMLASNEEIQAQGVYQTTKCVIAIGAFIAGNAFLATKVAKLGGAVKVALKILQSNNKWAVVVSIFGYATGITELIDNCGG